MPTTFISDWKRVATSGKTIDGRSIDAQDLRDMAETYNPEIYCATIWYEHIRYMGNFGKVTALKSEELEDGKVRLFAKLQPNDRLLQLNKEAQKLFSSVEIAPNFSDSGKAYLRGLAVTDEPASLGTEALHFSRRSKDGHHYGSVEPLGDLSPAESESDSESATALLANFFNIFQFKKTQVVDPVAPATSSDPETPDMDAKTAEAFTSAVATLGNVAKSLETSAAAFAAQKPAPAVETVVETPPAPAVEPTAVTATQFNELKTSLDTLTQTFNTALNQGHGQPVQLTTGAFTEQTEDVY
ncbi:hypothetical protein HDC30_005764 [Pseudomonas sp. JAI115]|uniref:GPO family capsid scaffolding protein n=1 Tax=Pseudomonas sp. JAI115 TaxID=2723061 RepID=UPI00161E53B0|nr:GPO family capsid scaffolding protein [Pseudomonas sp. JAI115]MBB6158506.1 hypothetical protein [Pseudomonas sp. JAI115]